MKGLFKEYFSYSKSETRSNIAILVLLVISIFFRILINNWPFSAVSPDPIQLKEITEFVIALEEAESKEIALKQKVEKKPQPLTQKTISIKENKFLLKYFDPNNAEMEELISIGINRNIAINIIRYRNAGGKFRKAEDIKKIYGMNDSIFNVIKGYILINQGDSKIKEITLVEKDIVFQPENDVIVELNSTDTSGLKKVKGIGSVFAFRIIKYRDILGGFYSHEQLNEVFGMDSLKYRSLLNYTFIDTLLIKKININTVDESLLRSHPYINSHTARSISYYRKISGEIRSFEELKDNGVLSPEIYEKCKWYFCLGNTGDTLK